MSAGLVNYTSALPRELWQLCPVSRSMDLGLEGKNAVVTGASKGIGLAVTAALAGAGAHVFAGARTCSTDLATLVRTRSVEFIAVDLSTADGPGKLIQRATTHGSIDVVVNNVGVAPVRTSGFLEVTDEQWQSTIDLNLMSAVRTARAVLPTMVTAGVGSIIMIGSINSTVPVASGVDYSASKAALASLAKALAREFGSAGIRVNTVSPGPVTTELWLGSDGIAAQIARHTGQNPQAIAATQAALAPSGRFTEAHEVADIVLLLASNRSANVNGADFLIDGGLLSTL